MIETARAPVPTLCIDLTQILRDHHQRTVATVTGTSVHDTATSATKKKRVVLGTINSAISAAATTTNSTISEMLSLMSHLHFDHLCWCESHTTSNGGHAYLACGGRSTLHLLSVGASEASVRATIVDVFPKNSAWISCIGLPRLSTVKVSALSC